MKPHLYILYPHQSVKLDDIISSQFSTICNIKKHDMTGATSEGGTLYPSGAPGFTHGFFVGYVLLEVLFFHLFFVWSLCFCPSSTYAFWLPLLASSKPSFKNIFEVTISFFFPQIGNTEEGERFCRFQQNMEGL